MPSRLSYKDRLRLLKEGNTLKELISACPDLWKETGEAINTHLSGGRVGPKIGEELNAFIMELQSNAAIWEATLRQSRNNPGVLERGFADMIRARMARLALQNYYLAALSGKQSGKLRFNLWNGTILQHLLFEHDLIRKPASLFWFRCWWPLITQKKILLRLVYKKGIYCFYSKPLISGLARLIRETAAGNRQVVLEVAAGDGTLARFLNHRKLNVIATDDFSWETNEKNQASTDSQVERLDAASALKKYKPAVVICSWPPAGNGFERSVFETDSVNLYVVVSSRHEFASGDWHVYHDAVSNGVFNMRLDEALSRQVLPPELDNAVYVFTRQFKAR